MISKTLIHDQLFKTYHSIIFDLYGTLIDLSINRRVNQLWESMSDFINQKLNHVSFHSKELKYCFQKHYSSRIQFLNSRTLFPEVNLEIIFKDLLIQKTHNFPLSIIPEILLHYRSLTACNLRSYRGVSEFLKKLHQSGKKLYILCNGQRFFSEQELKNLGLHSYFQKLYFSSDFEIAKPDPIILEHLLNKEKLNPHKTILIGNDHTIDIPVANQCKIHSLYLHSNRSQRIYEKSAQTIQSTAAYFKRDFFILQ